MFWIAESAFDNLLKYKQTSYLAFIHTACLLSALYARRRQILQQNSTNSTTVEAVELQSFLTWWIFKCTELSWEISTNDK